MRIHSRTWLCTLAVLALASPGAAQPAGRYAGRPLSDVLADLRTSGLNVVYSTRLVRPEMSVAEEPSAKTPRKILDEVLAPHSLVIRPGPADTLVVTRRPRPAGTSGGEAPRDPAVRFSETVDVSGREPTAPPGTQALTADQVFQAPGAVDNVFRALQLLPGVSGAGLYDSRVAVRGGAPDQNLTVMDGVEIHNPFRLMGAVAGFNPETVGRFELMPGAFPAHYGDRLSSILVVDTRDGRRDTAFAGAASASVTDASAVIEGRLGKGSASWLFAGRRTYYDLVAERLLDDDLPAFDDLQFKLSWRGAGGGRVALSGVRSREGTDSDFSDAADTLAVVSDGSTGLLSARYDAPVGGRIWLRGVLSRYEFQDSLDLDAQGLTDTRVSFARPSLAVSGHANHQLVTYQMVRRAEVEDLALRQEVAFQLAPTHRLEAGFEAHRLDTRWRYVLEGDRNDEEANGTSVILGSALPDFLDSSLHNERGAFFLQDRLALGRLVLQPGLRLERTGGGRPTAVLPRLQSALELGSWRLKLGAGLHAQSPGYEKLLHSDYFVELSPAEGTRLDEERALHLVLGLERTLGHGLSASLEGYYRDFERLVVGRLETEEERAARVARYDYPPALRWGIPVAARITTEAVNAAEGHAYGLLAYVRRDQAPSARAFGWLSYAWGVTERTAYGRTYPFDYDRPHALTAVGGFRVSRAVELSGSFRLASGRPTTPPRGVLVLGTPDDGDADGDGDRTEVRPARDEDGRPVYVADPGGADTLNSIRLPAFVQLDLRLTVQPRGPQGRWTFYAEVLNVLNRANATSYDWDIRLDAGALRPHVVVTDGEDGIPLVPTIGARFRF
jgi:hypothetical protein